MSKRLISFYHGRPADAGRAVSGLAVAWLVARGGTLGATHGWLYILCAALAVELAGWVWMWRAPASSALVLITAAGSAVMLAGVVVREAPRLAVVDPVRTAALEAAGLPVFAITALFGAAVIAWIVRVTRS